MKEACEGVDAPTELVLVSHVSVFHDGCEGIDDGTWFTIEHSRFGRNMVDIVATEDDTTQKQYMIKVATNKPQTNAAKD